MSEQSNTFSPNTFREDASSTNPVRTAKRTPSTAESAVHELTTRVVSAVERTDEIAARTRVEQLRNDHPDATADELVGMLIKNKCMQAGAVGAATSSASIMPGWGTLASLTVGIVADVGMTMKLQLDLVLEIAHVYGYEFALGEKQQALLLVAGIGVGSERVLYRYGVQLTEEAGERLAGRALAKAMPFVGMAASAALDMSLTYLIGKRAQAYFKLGPSGMQDWSASIRAITGMDERKLARWTKEASATTWRTLRRGVTAAGDTMRSAAQSSVTMVRSRT